ncbi:MAG: hypothetical protein DRN99_01925 [Thermoproteota archaeon]|nr:MAG: hypothetical protein DRN99_01925 [Candidatus Korarchaeota archaeon]
MLSLGGRELGDMIVKAAEAGRGAGGWRRVLRAYGIKLEEIKPKVDVGEEAPWDRIDVGGTEKLVLKEYYESMNALRT